MTNWKKPFQNHGGGGDRFHSHSQQPHHHHNNSMMNNSSHNNGNNMNNGGMPNNHLNSTSVEEGEISSPVPSHSHGMHHGHHNSNSNSHIHHGKKPSFSRHASSSSVNSHSSYRPNNILSRDNSSSNMADHEEGEIGGGFNPHPPPPPSNPHGNNKSFVPRNRDRPNWQQQNNYTGSPKHKFKPKAKLGSYASLSETASDSGFNNSNNNLNKRDFNKSMSWEPPRKREFDRNERNNTPNSRYNQHHNNFDPRRRRSWEKNTPNSKPFRNDNSHHHKPWERKESRMHNNMTWRPRNNSNVQGSPMEETYYGPNDTNSNSNTDYRGDGRGPERNAGPRFIPPPGQEIPEELKMDDLLNSPTKMRMESSLATDRGGNHYDSPSRGRYSRDSSWKSDKFPKRTPSFTAPPSAEKEKERAYEQGQMTSPSRDKIVVGSDMTRMSSASSIDAKPLVKDILSSPKLEPPLSVPLQSSVPPPPPPPPPPPKTIPVLSPFSVEPAPLTCASLNDADSSRKAVKAIDKMMELLEKNESESKQPEPIAMKAPQSVPLPNVEDIQKSLEEVKTQSKQLSQQLKLLKFKAQMAERQEEEKDEEEEARLQKEERDFERNIEEENELIKTQRENEKESIMSELSTARSSLQELDGQLVEQIQDTRITKSKKIVEEISKRYNGTLVIDAQNGSQAAGAEVSAAKTELENLEHSLIDVQSDLKEERSIQALRLKFVHRLETEKSMASKATEIPEQLKDIFESVMDEADDLNSIVRGVMEQNQQRAAQAHLQSISMVVPSAILNSSEALSPPKLVQELPEDDDNEFLEYVAEWTKKTQLVKGIADAIYTEPQDAPLFEKNHNQHKEISLIVKEHVRNTKRKLHDRWTELAEEYAIREKVYEKNTKRDSTNIHSPSFGGSYSIFGERRGGGGSENVTVEPSGTRSTNNPYRRPRRGLQVAGGDIVRSDYEQEQIIQQLTAQANMEKRIKQGKSDIPRQVCAEEKNLYVVYRDTMTHRRVDDPLAEEEKFKLRNPWSDMEKCIFFDRFLQHPKDFRKIASFLKNKSTHDCINFYYGSKQSVPYKSALKEHQLRKKKRDVVSWEATIQAAISLGATVTEGLDEGKPLLFHLPEHDQTFHTQLFHPITLELFEVGEIHEDDKPRPRKKKSALATTFTLDPSERKYLQGEPDASNKRYTSGSDVESTSSAKMSYSSSMQSISDALAEEDVEIPRKRGSSSWSESEKSTFFELLEKYGRKWQKISQVIGTKSAAQTRNFYYEQKKKTGGKSVKSGKKKVRDGERNKEKEAKRAKTEKKTDISNTPSLPTIDEKNPVHSNSNHSGNSTPMPSLDNSASNSVGNGNHMQSGGDMFAQQQMSWHENDQQRQLALALEQQRRLQQERQLLYEHQLAQQQQYINEHQRMRHQQQLLGILNQQQNDAMHQNPWMLLQQYQNDSSANSFREYVDRSGGLQNNSQLNMALAMRRFQQAQQQNNMNLNGNDGDLSILARLAADSAARSNHQNRHM